MEMFDKLLTYVDKSTDLTQSMVDNYKNSMIVLGDQKQMYIPILNSYIGLGIDAYNYLNNKLNTIALDITPKYSEENQVFYFNLFKDTEGVLGSYTNSKLKYNPDKEWLESTYFIGTLQGNALTASRLKENIDLWGNTFNGSQDVNGNIIPNSDNTYTLGNSTYYFAYAYVNNLVGNARSADYSTYSYTSYLTCYSYNTLFTGMISGFFPISFTDYQELSQRYYAYSHITGDKQVVVPAGYTIDDLLDIHNIDLIRFKNFDCGLYWYEDQNALFSTYFRGMLLGVASYADSLYTPVKINGTDFNGTLNITTTYWGNSRVFNITDNTLVNYGPDANVHGDTNIILKLPKKAVLDIDGKSSYAGESDLSNRTYRQSIRLTNSNNSYYITFTDSFSNNAYAYSYVNTNLKFNPYDEILYSTYFNGWLKGNADTASQLFVKRKINYTDFDGSEDIITTYWGAPRNIVISDFHNTYTYTNTDIDGGQDFTLKLPENIHANLNGNADTATFAESTYLSNNAIRMFNYNTTTDSSYLVTFTNNVNTYSYSYVNGSLIYNPNTEELESSYFHATYLFRGQIRAQDQWGVMSDGHAPQSLNTAEAETNSESIGGG